MSNNGLDHVCNSCTAEKLFNNLHLSWVYPDPDLIKTLTHNIHNKAVYDLIH